MTEVRQYLPRMSTDQTRMEPLAHGGTTSRVIGAAFEVHTILGYGSLEKVYQARCSVLINFGRKRVEYKRMVF
jgi:PD-(D/E)XK nuclease superfamily